MPRFILRRATLPVLQCSHTIRQRVRRATVRVALLSLILWAGAASLQFSGAAPAFAAPLATVDDWPTFLHDPARSAASGDTTLSTANAAQLAKLWSYKTGGVVAASPTIVGGTVYVGSWDGYEYALDAATGALRWKTSLGVTNAPACNPPSAGISSAATVQGGVVYVGGGDSNWYALNATTGAILWSVYTGDNSATGGHYNWASPLIYNGFAYIGIASLGDCPLVQGQLQRVDLTTHQIVATYNVVPNGQVGGGIWTSPTLDTATNTIYVTTGTESYNTQSYAQALLALDATTLTLKDSWKLPESQAVPDSDFGTTPILFSDAAGDQLVGAINKNGMFYAFRRNNLAGGPFWQQQVAAGGDCPQCAQGSVSSSAFANGLLYVSGGNTVIGGRGYSGSVRALNPATGAVVWAHGAPDVVIAALAYSNGLIVDGAGSTLEVLDVANGTRLYSYAVGGTIYAAPSVAHGTIFTGGVDGSVYAFGLATVTPPPADPNCPSGWTCQDIGSPSPAGSETVSGGAWSVSAGGAGVGGTSDQFRLLAQSFTSDTQVTARIPTAPTPAPSAQAGIMVRQNPDPGSPYYALFVTANNGLVAQYRTRFGGATTVTNTVSNVTLPLYLQLQRVGDQIQAATSTDGVSYTLVPGTTATVLMPASIRAGLLASSGANGTQGSASFASVAVGAPSGTPAPPPSSTPCPTGWNCADIGNPLLVGSQSLSAGTWTVQGAGNDIWDASDQFHYVWQPLSGDGTASVHVTSQQNTSDWAKAGAMLRQGTDAGAAYYAVYVTPSNGLAVQYREASYFQAQTLTTSAGTVPAYLRVARVGTTFTTYTSTDGTAWTALSGSTITLSGLNGSILAGMAVTSHNGGVLSSVTADMLSVAAGAPPPCLASWTCADIGYTTPAGSQSVSSAGVWTVQGAGSDIWGASDQFHYAWQPLAADGTVSAHVSSQTNSSGWAKAGVMLRLSSNPAAPFYAAYVTPSNGLTVQYRATAGANAAQASLITGNTPVYLQVARAGTTFTAYTSIDGITWTAVPGSSITLASLSAPLLAGLAVTSHNGGMLSTATFDTISISAGCVGGWSCADVGYTTPAGSQSVSSAGVWTVQGAGSDIWGASDQFHYAWRGLSGDGTVSAHVTSQTNSSGWAKAGVMLRLNADPAAPFYALYVTPSNGLAVQYRAMAGASASQAASIAGTVPGYLRVGRSGATFTAYTSTNGTTWTPLAGSTVALSGLSGTLLAGLAVTSHNGGAPSTVTFDTISIASNSAPTPPACVAGWSCADIGYTTPAGSQSVSSAGVWTVQGAGSDIWGSSDQFHFVWQSMPGNGTFSVHVTNQTNSSGWAKAGVMLRLSNDPAAPFYALYITPGNGLSVQYRASAGANAAQLVNIAGTAPVYLRVSRSGTIFTAYTSADGVTWTALAGSTITLSSLSGSILQGMADTSHNASVICTVTFDTVAVSTTAAAVAVAAPQKLPTVTTTATPIATPTRRKP